MLQLEIFIYSFLFGAVLGIIYDIFRIIRLFFKSRFWNVFIQDIIYFFFSGVSTFLFILFINSGEIRFYILAGEAIGFIIYYLTLGNIIYSICDKFSGVIKKIYTKITVFLFAPINKLISKIRITCLKNKINSWQI